jgi:thiol-disulfide isomerase/thioredoxin
MPADREPDAGIGPGSDRGPRAITRIGLALVAPRWALAIADRPEHAGRSGSDLIRMLGVLLAAVHLRRLIAVGWLAAAVGVGAGLRGLVATLSHALTVDLAFLVVATVVLWLAAGPRRSVGRAFDQVCVAALPIIAVEVVATGVVRAADLAVPPAAMIALTSIAYAWAGALVALGWRQIRRAPPPEVPVPAAVLRRGRRAGLGLLLAAAAVLVINLVWIARNVELLRPVVAGDPAPAFALPAIQPDGTLGAPVLLEDRLGKVVVVDIWATWCGPCVKSLPNLAAIQRQLGGDGEVILINIDDPPDARKLVDARAPGLTLVFDNQGVQQRYGASSYPHTVVIDRAGRIRAVFIGGGQDAELAEAISLARQ